MPEVAQDFPPEQVESHHEGLPSGVELAAVASWIPQVASLDNTAGTPAPVLKMELAVIGTASRSVVAVGEVLVDEAKAPTISLVQTAALSIGLDRGYEVVPSVLTRNSPNTLVTTIPLEFECPEAVPISMSLEGTLQIITAGNEERLDSLTFAELKNVIASRGLGEIHLKNNSAGEPQVLIETLPDWVLRDWAFATAQGVAESSIWTQEEYDPREGGTVILGSSGRVQLDKLRFSCTVTSCLKTHTVKFQFSGIPVPEIPATPGSGAVQYLTWHPSRVVGPLNLQVRGRAQQTPLMGFALDQNSVELVLDLSGAGLDSAIAAGELTVTTARAGSQPLQLGDPVGSVDIRRRIVSLEELGQTLKRRWQIPMEFPVDGPLPQQLDEVSGQLKLILAQGSWLKISDAFTPGVDRLSADELQGMTLKLERFDGNQFVLVVVGANASRVGRLSVIDEGGRRVRSAQCIQTTLPGAVEYSIGFEGSVPAHAGLKLEWFPQTSELEVPFTLTNIPVVTH